MNWLEQIIKAGIIVTCLAVVYVTITDVMAKIKTDAAAAQVNR
jgi:hypothetical protein